MNLKESFSLNNVEKIARKEFVAFMTFFLSSMAVFAGNTTEKNEMTPDVIKKVYVKYQQYMNTHKNDTIHIDIGDFDISMNSFEKGYQVTLAENKITTTHPDQQTTSIKTEKDTYVFIDSNGDGTPDDVKHNSSSKTSTISNNQSKPVKLLSSETRPVIEKTWQGAMKVIDTTL